MKSKPILSLLAVLLVAGSTAFAEGRAIDQSTKPWVNGGQSKPDKKVQVVLSTGSVAMSCEKCKSVTEMRKRDIGKPGYRQELVAVSVHQCAGCRDEFVRKQGTKDMMLVHKCADCGSKSVYCCATTMPKVPTNGMM
jgi:hypothetical protein